MADYQHVVAVHADMSRSKKRKWSEVEQHFGEISLSCYSFQYNWLLFCNMLLFPNVFLILVMDIVEKTGLIDMDNEDLMLLVPQFFSAKDKPTTLV